jgi:hypothetical protein
MHFGHNISAHGLKKALKKEAKIVWLPYLE